MARTQPHTQWSDRSADARTAGGSGEWDALRNELATLIDQVETRLKGHAVPPDASPRQDSEREAAHGAAPEDDGLADRHSRALHSVRRAVDRLSEKSGPGQSERRRPLDHARSAEIADAIGQIRARQGSRHALSHDDGPSTGERHGTRQSAARAPRREDLGSQAGARPTESDPAVLGAMLNALRDLGSRMEGFETRFSGQLSDLGSNRDVAEQVAQLADVVELLAGVVGDDAPVNRIEHQIAELAEAVAHAPASDDAVILARLEALSGQIDALSGAQADMTASQDAAGRYADATMRFVEDSVRGIYERIDAIDASHSSSPQDLEKISADLAGLAKALDDREAQARDSLAERFDSLERRIDGLAAAEPGGAQDLRDAVGNLRTVVLEAVEPRFDAIESRLESLGGQSSGLDSEDIAGQLRRIGERIDETGVQIEGLLAIARGAAEAEDTTDFSALADMVAERTRAQLPEAPAASARLDSADIDSLEERLSRLFSESRTPEADPAPFARFGETIASVDSRLAQIEATLNGQRPAGPRPVTKTLIDDSMALSAAPALGPRGADRSEAPAQSARDAMPDNPDGDEPLRQRRPVTAHAIPDPEAVAREARASAASPDAFHLDPETVARPEKPVSSLDVDAPPIARAAPVSPEARNEPEQETGELHAAVNRANFIEAARRAARNHADAEDAEPPKSLIGRALARFQSSEAQVEPQADVAVSSNGKRATDRVERAEPDMAFATPDTEAVPDQAEASDAEARSESFLRRHRRPLLLAAALLVALLLTANLVSQRLLSGPDAPAGAVSQDAADGDAASAEPVAPDVAPPDATAPEATAPEATAPESEAAPVTPIEPIAPVGIDGTQTSPAEGNAATPDAALLDPAPGGTARSQMGFAPSGGSGLDASLLDPVTTASTGGAAITALPGSGAPLGETTPASPMPVAEVPDGIGPEGLRNAAEGGDMFAQFEIAAILTEGHVVEQDLAQAAAWYERSAAQGFAPAQYRLGNLYESGQGVQADLEQARLWYQRAAEGGNRMSMHNLASLYAGGQLENQDFAAAAHWFEQAAARGMTDSQFNLGMLYARGLGVEQSFADSYTWFSLAALSGDADAVQARDDVARSLDTATIQALDTQIATWAPVTVEMQANFAPIGTWDDAFEVGETITNREVVLRVQELLGKLGYEIGTPDGLIGPLTREAIASFERQTGMSESGQVNPRLLAVLGSQPV